MSKYLNGIFGSSSLSNRWRLQAKLSGFDLGFNLFVLYVMDYYRWVCNMLKSTFCQVIINEQNLFRANSFLALNVWIKPFFSAKTIFNCIRNVTLRPYCNSIMLEIFVGTGWIKMFQDFNIYKKFTVISSSLLFAKVGAGTRHKYILQDAILGIRMSELIFIESLQIQEKGTKSFLKCHFFFAYLKLSWVATLQKMLLGFYDRLTFRKWSTFWNLLFCWFTHDTVKKNLSGQCTPRTLNYLRRSKWWAVNCRNK